MDYILDELPTLLNASPSSIRMSPDRVGVRFDFGEPVKPLVLNWGDELYVAEHYPDDAGDDELQEIPIMPM
jgi:hypothetical protein